MAQTKRAQVMIEPEEYAQLEKLARHKNISVAELFRIAVRECFLTEREDKRNLVKQIRKMNVSIADWDELEKEIEAGKSETIY